MPNYIPNIIMIKKLLFAICVFTTTAALAQQDTLRFYNYNRYHIQSTGMTVLGSWAVANIATGVAGNFAYTGQTRYFYQMNALWNVVNLGAAVTGYLGSRRAMTRDSGPAESMKLQRNLERTFLINAGLDLVYIGAGLEVHHRGNVNNSDRQRGYGSSFALQGAFLLLFDGTMYAAERHNGNRLIKFLVKNQLIFTGNQAGMRLNF